MAYVTKPEKVFFESTFEEPGRFTLRFELADLRIEGAEPQAGEVPPLLLQELRIEPVPPPAREAPPKGAAAPLPPRPSKPRRKWERRGSRRARADAGGR